MLCNALSVQEYKQIFDDNNYKSDNYEVALFINFLMKKSKLVREIGELTGLKKSQIHSYKKIIKLNKTEELRTTPFRKVLKSCTEAKPKVEEDLIEAIEKLGMEETPHRSKYEGAHFFNEMEYSPGKSSYRKNDFCPCEINSEGLCRTGQREVHTIPYPSFATNTFLRLTEITEHATHARDLEKKQRELEARVRELETRNKELEEENIRLRAEH